MAKYSHLYFVTYDLKGRGQNVKDNDTLENLFLNKSSTPPMKKKQVNIEGGRIAESCWFVSSSIKTAEGLKDYLEKDIGIKWSRSDRLIVIAIGKDLKLVDIAMHHSRKRKISNWQEKQGIRGENWIKKL